MYIPNFGALESQAHAQVAKEERELRDWFAGQALAGWWACPNTMGNMNDTAKAMYEAADAMLKAREQ